jgi:hypothetical protein
MGKDFFYHLFMAQYAEYLLSRTEEEQGFSRFLVENLIEALETNSLPHLTPNEHAHLLVLIQATLEVTVQH